jgi:hypothetical protein
VAGDYRPAQSSTGKRGPMSVLDEVLSANDRYAASFGEKAG